LLVVADYFNRRKLFPDLQLMSEKPCVILIPQLRQNFIENITISGNVVISSETEENLADYEMGLDGGGRKKTIVSFKIS